jgi:hypothetical protein
MFTTERSGTTIGTLRLRGAADPLAARLRAQALLDAADLRPPSLPRSAVLVVCSLRVEAGGVFSRAPDVMALRAWESALRGRLDALARGAWRPADGPVPAGAEAVRFADRAELLACAARDLCEGRVAERWWWRRALGEGTATAVTRAWAASPELAPGALATLARTGHARAFVEVLSDDGARSLGAAMLRRHGLDESADALEVRPPPGSVAPRPRAEPPWAAEESELPGGGAGRRALLGAALTLARAPSRARGADFRRALAAWLAAWRAAEASAEQSFEAEPSGASPARRGPMRDRPAPPGEVIWPGIEAAEERRRFAPQAPAEAPVIRPRTVAPERPREERVRGEATAPSDDVRGATPELRALDAPGEGPPLRRSGPRTTASPRSDAAGAAQAEPRTMEDATVVSTALGGVFFLVLVGVRLGLYGDFSTPREPGIALSIWDWLALMGRALLGDGYDDDPLWALLATLAGRAAGELPGEGIEPPSEWRAPEGWRDEDEREPASCGADARPIDRWVATIAPQVRGRLLRALGVAREELAAVLLVRAARVRVTASHLDVAMALAEHPVEVRRAGLDRDVGWVPAAGRYVAFQFE